METFDALWEVVKFTGIGLGFLWYASDNSAGFSAVGAFLIGLWCLGHVEDKLWPLLWEASPSEQHQVITQPIHALPIPLPPSGLYKF